MSNLSKRVEKAKKLSFSHNPYSPGKYGTWGSEGNEFGEKYYNISLSHATEKITIINPDRKEKFNMSVFLVDCQKDTGNGTLCNCPGNERHAVCYHGLGAIYQGFKAKDKLVAFFETYETARQMAFGGKMAKVKSVNGGGHLWCVIRDWPESKTKKKSEKTTLPGQDDSINYYAGIGSTECSQILSTQKNINLMRGNEDDEGID